MVFKKVQDILTTFFEPEEDEGAKLTQFSIWKRLKFNQLRKNKIRLLIYLSVFLSKIFLLILA